MLRSLKIENFRCFQAFELQQLGRINLLVGKNNSGKTSILEAVQLLCSPRKFEVLHEIMSKRGEYIRNGSVVEGGELDISHLFYGHKIEIDKQFLILGNNNSESQKLSVTVKQIEKIEKDNLFDYPLELELALNWVVQNQEAMELKLSLSPQDGLPVKHLKIRRFKDVETQTMLITLSSLTTGKMIELFDKIVLTPEEQLIIQALKIIEPKILRIAAVSSKSRGNDYNSGFLMSFGDSNQPIPIGSMGDGIWRILGLTLALVNAKNGILLVDEIDTGLHFTAMYDMWKLVWETAKNLNIQVFATTHNSDCWTSLAEIANAENPSEDGITIQRIERNKPHSILFTERQIAIAAERGIEVR